MLKKLIRKPYRRLLTKITAEVIEKHQPKIIAVVGDGQTSIARELVYSVVKKKFPARRNLEAPEAEFDVPFTVIGAKSYPKTVLGWISVLLKAKYNLKTLEPYSHFLILELNFIDAEILRHWLEVLKPETLLIVGGIPLDYSEMNFKKIVKISSADGDDILGPFKIAVRQIGRFYKLSDEILDETFETFSLPSSKIRYLPGKNASTVLDATHHYLPIKIESVLELFDENEENVVLFSTVKGDSGAVNGKKVNFNPKNYQPAKDDLIVLRGNRAKTLQKYENLITSL